MTPKFRIYDKEVGYYVSNTRFLLSMDGRLLDTYDTTWHEVGERYVVEMATDVFDLSGNQAYQGDVISCINPNDGEVYTTSFGVNDITGIYFNNSELSSELSLYEYCMPNNIIIIGTIHDEKYKGL